MNDKHDIVDSINNVSEEETQTESQRVYTLFYTFFLIPLMIVVFGALFFGLFYTITEEPTDVDQLLTKLEQGSTKDKANASIQLNQLFFNDKSTYDPKYRSRIIDIHKSAREDKYANEQLRIYTIQIMGNSGDKGFGETLIEELSADKLEFRTISMESLGKLQYEAAALEITPFLNKNKDRYEKLAAAGALGNIGNKDAIEALVQFIESGPQNQLDSDGKEPTWDAALSLLRLGYSDATSEDIINNLLNREYLKAVKVINLDEAKKSTESNNYTILYVVLGLLILILFIKVKNKSVIMGIVVSVAVIVGGIVFLSDDDNLPINNRLTDDQINKVISIALNVINLTIEKNEKTYNSTTFLVEAFEDNIAKLSSSDSNLEIRDFAKKVYKHYK